MRRRTLGGLMLGCGLLLGGAALAQEATPAPEPVAPAEPAAKPRSGAGPVAHIQKTFVLKHADPLSFEKLLKVFPASISIASVSGQSVISVSGAPQVVAAIEETIKRLDVPSTTPSYEVLAQLVSCSKAGAPPETTPAELADVVAQLKKTFGYEGCSVAQDLFVRATAGQNFEASVGGMRKDEWFMILGSIEPLSTDPSVVHFSELVYRDSSGARRFRGPVTMREGQRPVLGTVGSLGTDRVGVIVLSAKRVL